jgi:hypothetical protein
MKRLYAALLAWAFVMGVGMTGCDRASETHTSETRDPQGNVIKKDVEKTTVDNAGNVKKDESHTDNR